MKYYSRIIANRVMKNAPQYHLTPKGVDRIVEASTLHDMGKIAIPDSVLLKPGKLPSEEFEDRKTHAEKDAELSTNWNGYRMRMFTS